MHPVLILLIGVAVVIGGIVALRLNAFLALIAAAILVSLLAPGETAERITRVATAFGTIAGGLGVIIAAAAIVGNAMKESGAADRIVQGMLRALGERRADGALASGGYLLSVPVFFDTVFFLLVPLARSTFRRTGRGYLKYMLAIPAGGVATHALVPPTPGALAAAVTLGVDLGVMMGIGAIVALAAATAGLAFARWADTTMRPPACVREGAIVPDHDAVRQPREVGPTGAGDREPRSLPGLFPSLLPILLPVILIAGNTGATALATRWPGSFWASVAPYAAVAGDANVALLVAAALALWVYHDRRRPTRQEASSLVEESLMAAGVIILITAAGGAFGAMLREAGIGDVIGDILAGDASPGILFLMVAFTVSSLLKIAQGSSTVAMITTAAMLVGVARPDSLPFHPVYLATAIGGGAMVGSWMNDSGFWVFARMAELTEVEALKVYTPLLALAGFAALLATIVLALLLPMS